MRKRVSNIAGEVGWVPPLGRPGRARSRSNGHEPGVKQAFSALGVFGKCVSDQPRVAVVPRQKGLKER